MVEEDPEVDVLQVSIYGEMEAGSDSVKVSSAPGFRRLTPKRRTSAASRRAWSDAAVKYQTYDDRIEGVKDDVDFPDDVEFQYEIPQGRILNVYRFRRRRMFTSAVLLYKIYIGIFFMHV